MPRVARTADGQLPAKITNIQELKSTTNAVITRSDAARLLGIEARTVTKAIAEGTFPALLIGSHTFMLREPFIAVLEGKSVSCAVVTLSETLQGINHLVVGQFTR